MGMAADFLLDELRHARASRELNQDDFGKLINYSGSHVSAVETGQRPPKADYVAAIDKAFGTGGTYTRLFLKMIEIDTTPPWMREWILFEQQARELRWYETAWVPGLLQTEAYARAVYECNSSLNAEEVAARVARRLERQKILSREDPPRLVAVLDEGVLHRPVGGSAVMREQLFHLARLNAERRRGRIHVVPSSVGAYAGLDGPFIIATLPDGEEVASLENQLQGQVTGRAADLAKVKRQWEDVLAEALTVPQSTELIERVAKTWI